MATAAPLKIEHISPKRLNPAKYNPRKMSEKAHAALRRGVEAFGLVDPIIARRKDGLVIGGHQRLAVAKELGLATVPVVFVALDDQKAAALNVLLNNPSAQGEWDFALLSGLLSELDGHGFDATLTGFDDEELAKILGADALAHTYSIVGTYAPVKGDVSPYIPTTTAVLARAA